MPPDASIGVDDVLTPGESRVSRRSAEDERAAPVDVDVGGVVHPGADDRMHHVFHHIVAELLRLDLGVMLSGDDDGVRALRLAVRVLNRDL